MQKTKWEDLNTDRYYEYINKIIEERGQWSIPEGEYFEGHHIIFRCFGGDGKSKKKDLNIIWLYPTEHYTAHKILAEDNEDDISVVSAWSMMAFPKGDTKRDFEISAEEYSKLRKLVGSTQSKREVSEATRSKMSANHADIRGENHPMFGRKHTEESKLKMSLAKRGNNNPAYGKPGTMRGKKMTDETKEKMRKSRSKYKHWKLVDGIRVYY